MYYWRIILEVGCTNGGSFEHKSAKNEGFFDNIPTFRASKKQQNDYPTDYPTDYATKILLKTRFIFGPQKSPFGLSSRIVPKTPSNRVISAQLYPSPVIHQKGTKKAPKQAKISLFQGKIKLSLT